MPTITPRLIPPTGSAKKTPLTGPITPRLSSLDLLSNSTHELKKKATPLIAPVDAPHPVESKPKKKKLGDEEWNCGGIMCSYRCIYNAIKGIFTKQGWLRTWWRGTGDLKYLSREEFELSLNSYAELLRLLDFYVAQRESGQIEAKDMSKVKNHRKPKHMKLQSIENAERQDQYLEAFLTGITRLLRGSGSPTWRIDYQLIRVAEGLGIKGMTVKIFPGFVLATLPPNAAEFGRRTMCFNASLGYNMHKLIKADNLARSVAALATNTDNFEHMVLPAISSEVQKLVVIIANAPEKLDQVFGFAYDPKMDKKAPRMRMAAKLEEAESYINMLTQRLGSKDAAVAQLKDRIIELAHKGTGFFSFDIRRLASEIDPDWNADGKAALVYELRRIAFLEISLEYALTELDAIEKAPDMFSRSNQILFGGVTAMSSVGLFFGGSWFDVLLCFCLGTLIGFLGEVFTSNSFRRLFEIISAFIVGFVSLVCSVMFPHRFCYPACSIAAVVNLVQGVSITMAIVEVATRNIVTGTSRLFYSLLISILIGMGTIAGAEAGLKLLPAIGLADYGLQVPSTCQNTPVPGWAWPVLLACSTIASCGKYGAGIKLMPVMLAAMWIAYGVNTGAAVLGDTVNGVLSAFCVGVFSNMIQKIWPWFTPFVPILGGLMILVPGSMAVRGFASILNTSNDDINGLTVSIRILFAGLTLGLGLFLSSLVVTPIELISNMGRNKHKRTLKALSV